MTAPQTIRVWCSVNTKHKRTFWIEMVFFWKAVYWLHSRAQTLKVVDDPADGLNVRVLGLPFIMAAVVATFHHIHPTPEVWLLIHHPAEWGQNNSKVIVKPELQLLLWCCFCVWCQTHAPSPYTLTELIQFLENPRLCRNGVSSQISTHWPEKLQPSNSSIR